MDKHTDAPGDAQIERPGTCIPGVSRSGDGSDEWGSASIVDGQAPSHGGVPAATPVVTVASVDSVTCVSHAALLRNRDS
ncbi:hypothetical protein GCM10017712_14430 [Curtobacterium citreum]